MPSSNSGSTPAEKAGTHKTADCNYTCTMHPAVCSDKPGLCPKCGMELTEKE
ncbi:heavy metal-binding domain-containing protein [Mucilaginibacter lacusdianchii]|uniref:heavy metal-binding domain-containing protein n=1 Tax=Mucilaginibacter lacusdianchii TaxID=2684211 RepID=UPI001E300E9E|nr:heavy metal-binding domain-containing protein [Mucilaginibacter sp. JXJ CY 39]